MVVTIPISCAASAQFGQRNSGYERLANPRQPDSAGDAEAIPCPATTIPSGQALGPTFTFTPRKPRDRDHRQTAS